MPDKVVDGEQVQDEVDRHQKQHLDHRMVQRFKHQNRNTIKKSKISLEIPKKMVIIITNIKGLTITITGTWK